MASVRNERGSISDTAGTVTTCLLLRLRYRCYETVYGGIAAGRSG